MFDVEVVDSLPEPEEVDAEVRGFIVWEDGVRIYYLFINGEYFKVADLEVR